MFIIGLEYCGCSRDDERKEKETANMTRESVLNHAIDCRTRETILSSLRRPTRKNSVPRIRARRRDICDAYKIRGGYFIATIMTAERYILFSELDFDSRISILTVLPRSAVC